MPVFGKGRTGRKGITQKLPNRKQILRKGKKRSLQKGPNWKHLTTTLSQIKEASGFDLLKEISSRVKTGKSVFVFDWGCGDGTAATQIAKRFGDKVEVIGCSDIAFKEWIGNDKVRFIHETKEGTLRYIKNNSMDFIFSHQGLYHLSTNMQDYVNKLVLKLRPKGKLLISPVYVPFCKQEKLPKNSEFEFKLGFIQGKESAAVITRLK